MTRHLLLAALMLSCLTGNTVAQEGMFRMQMSSPLLLTGESGGTVSISVAELTQRRPGQGVTIPVSIEGGEPEGLDLVGQPFGIELNDDRSAIVVAPSVAGRFDFTIRHGRSSASVSVDVRDVSIGVQPSVVALAAGEEGMVPAPTVTGVFGEVSYELVGDRSNWPAGLAFDEEEGAFVGTPATRFNRNGYTIIARDSFDGSESHSTPFLLRVRGQSCSVPGVVEPVLDYDRISLYTYPEVPFYMTCNLTEYTCNNGTITSPRYPSCTQHGEQEFMDELPQMVSAVRTHIAKLLSAGRTAAASDGCAANTWCSATHGRAIQLGLIDSTADIRPIINGAPYVFSSLKRYNSTVRVGTQGDQIHHTVCTELLLNRPNGADQSVAVDGAWVSADALTNRSKAQQACTKNGTETMVGMDFNIQM